MISEFLTGMLCCPDCGGDLDNEGTQLLCVNCRRAYPVVHDIPRFVSHDHYTSSFSFEWQKYSRLMLDSVSGNSRAEEMFLERTGLTPEDIRGKIVLDAGCGSGRFIEVAKRFGGQVVGIDLSYSVEQTLENLPGTDLAQADIMQLPFREGSFDIVFSIGVIHHTYSASLAFERLARLVKPGGKLAVWVYSDDNLPMKMYNQVSNFYRLFTTRMSEETLYRLCQHNTAVYNLHRLPVLGSVCKVLIPASDELLPEWRALNNFDWYSPKHQSKHTYREVDSWFNRHGFTDITNLKVGVSVLGTKEQRITCEDSTAG